MSDFCKTARPEEILGIDEAEELGPRSSHFSAVSYAKLAVKNTIQI
jgi:hypothetical protein